MLYLLRKYLGEYVEGLSIDALRISVWKGLYIIYYCSCFTFLFSLCIFLVLWNISVILYMWMFCVIAIMLTCRLHATFYPNSCICTSICILFFCIFVNLTFVLFILILIQMLMPSYSSKISKH